MQHVHGPEGFRVFLGGAGFWGFSNPLTGAGGGLRQQRLPLLPRGRVARARLREAALQRGDPCIRALLDARQLALEATLCRLAASGLPSDHMKS